MKNKHISSLLSTILVSIPLLTACDVGRELARSAMDVVRNPQTDVGKQVLGSSSYKRSKLKNLEFTCVKEQFPSLPQEADQLYRYALYHDFKNRWLPKPGVLDRYLPYCRRQRTLAGKPDFAGNLAEEQRHQYRNPRTSG